MRFSTPQVSITSENGALVYCAPYDQMLVAQIKRHIPATDRQWDKVRRAWLVAPKYGKTLVQITEDCLDVTPQLPIILPPNTAPETRLLEVRYIGTTKDRGDDERTAYGWCDGGWNVIFPERVLCSWFGIDAHNSGAAITLYGVLGINQKATENDIRKAYRRLALQWHPDRCKEPGAKEQFIAIQRAYETLNNPCQRARYDAGLVLESTLEKSTSTKQDPGYRSPLRCGLILCDGTVTIGRFIVSEIRVWEDITNASGQVLSTSWPLGADMFVENWSI